MPKLTTLPEPEMLDVLAKYPQGFAGLCDYHDGILRGPSELTPAERELIATYVSGLNQCNFCYGAHRTFAEVHGIDPAMFEQLVADPASAGVNPKLLPILAYAKKLTLAPSTVTEGDAAAVYDAGWGEEALFTAVSVTALFNLMNRLVEGTGITANPMLRKASKDRIERDLDNPTPYGDFAHTIQAEHEKRYGGSY
jgi:uncharacterized peroxidase-related enzyme